ncbi:MAG: serine hydrolase domain-containing protein [Bacteroidota bacterium]
MKSQTLLITAFILLLGACRTSDDIKQTFQLPHSEPEAVGVSASKLAKMDSVFASYTSSKKVPAVGAMMIRKDQVVYHSAHGERILGADPLDKKDIFRIASMSKPVTVVAALILLEEAKLKLDDPIEKFIPEFASPKVIETFREADTTYSTIKAESSITIRHLMTHTAGIGYPFIQKRAAMLYYPQGILDAFSLDSVKIEETATKIAGLPLLHQPGQKYTYGLSIDVLGRIVEIASGQDLASFMEERIFEPLGMEDTGFYLPAEKADRLVEVYVPDSLGGLISIQKDQNDFPINYPIQGAQTYYSGGAGLCSTVEDYARFALMLENGGIFSDTRILQEASVQKMASNHLDPQYFGEYQFGLGVGISQADEGALHPDKLGRFGWGGYFKTRYWSDPSEDFVIVMMCQMGPSGIASDQMMDQAMKLAYESLKVE